MSDAQLSNTVGLADERFVPGTHRGELMEAEHYARYFWASALVAGRRVLDAGCGVGYGSQLLHGAGAAEVVGLDVSADAMEAARRATGAGLRFEQGDLHQLPFQSGEFDVVVCFEVIEHVDGRELVLHELHRVLAPNGVLVVSSPNRDVYPSGNPHHVYEYRPDELRAALAKRFTNVGLRRQHDWISSAVLDDEQIAQEDPVRPVLDLECAKVAGSAPGSEIYTVAIASDGALPSPPPRSVWTGFDEPLRWLAERQALREENGRLRTELHNERCTLARLTEERDVVQRMEQGLREDAATLIAELDAARASLHRLYRSSSWRMTKPLRAIGRLLRRGSAPSRR